MNPRLGILFSIIAALSYLVSQSWEEHWAVETQHWLSSTPHPASECAAVRRTKEELGISGEEEEPEE